MLELLLPGVLAEDLDTLDTGPACTVLYNEPLLHVILKLEGTGPMNDTSIIEAIALLSVVRGSGDRSIAG